MDFWSSGCFYIFRCLSNSCCKIYIQGVIQWFDCCLVAAFTFGGGLADSLWLASSLREREGRRETMSQRRNIFPGYEHENRNKDGEGRNSSHMQFWASSTWGRQNLLKDHLLSLDRLTLIQTWQASDIQNRTCTWRHVLNVIVSISRQEVSHTR